MSKLLVPITRRQFVRLALAGTASALVEAACQGPPGLAPATPAASLSPPPTPEATATTSPSATPRLIATFPPLPRNRPKLLQNRNDPHYNVRYVNPFEPVNHETWRLEVKGMVESPTSFSLKELLAWPQREQISRMRCVEGWSFEARWGGFHYNTLAGQARPLPEATHVRFDCADAYWEIVSIEELAGPKVVFVLRMNDELLLDEYGAPLRMIFPTKYGYKSAKAVTTVTFADEGGKGYWPTFGGYSPEGDIY